MSGHELEKKHQHPDKKNRDTSHGRTTKRRSEIERRRVITRQHSTARGASSRR